MTDLDIKLFDSVSRRGAALTDQQRRLCAENVARLNAQRAAGIKPGPPRELDVLRERERVRPKTQRYIGSPLAISLLDLVMAAPATTTTQKETS